MSDPPEVGRALVIACGALAREILAVIEANRLDHVTLRCLPASLHNEPRAIPAAVRQALSEAGPFEQVLVAYGDCGTGGQLDGVLAEAGASRLPGPHCYAFYQGIEAFERNEEADMRAYFLTDFLVRQFEALVIKPLGLDRRPMLRDAYFGQYEKIVYLAQTDDPELLRQARVAADRLGLAFEHRRAGYGALAPAIVDLGRHSGGPGLAPV